MTILDAPVGPSQITRQVGPLIILIEESKGAGLNRYDGSAIRSPSKIPSTPSVRQLFRRASFTSTHNTIYLLLGIHNTDNFEL